MIKPFSFYIKLIGVSSLFFLLHIFVLNKFGIEMFSNKIIASYLINVLSAIFLYFIINKLKYRFRNSLGFIFMANSFLKFTLFFLFIYPSYIQDDVVSNLEFSTFFIPYIVCLILETLALIKLLTELDKKNKK